VTILQVFVGNLPFVSRVGFTCWNTKNNNMTNSLPTYGGAEVTNLRMICPSGQIAVGIFGHAGSAIDQLGLICDNWVSPAGGSAAGNTLGQKIVAYAKAHMGQCFTDANGHTQQGACPPTGNKDTDTGPGECTYLVQSAVVASGGQPPNYNVTKIPGTDTDQKQPLAISGLPYTWGDPVNPPYQPGDIIQLTITRFVGPDNTTVVSFTDSQHTAIIESIGAGNDLTVINEHNPNRIVTESEFNLSWKLTRGSYQVFRARPQ
jgi:hypothetical protein